MQEGVPTSCFSRETGKATISGNVTRKGECKRTRQWHVYFIKSEEGHVKIGCSVRPEDRLLATTEWMPSKVWIEATLPGSYRIEGLLHKKFAADRISGEWFRASPRLLAMIDDVKAGRPIDLDLTEGEAAFDSRSDARRKAVLGSKMTRAERKHLGRYAWNERPREILALQERWQGAHYKLTDEDVAMVEAYVARLVGKSPPHKTRGIA